jgi:hypothetical protein
MRAALVYALRRTSARVVLALGVGGLLFWGATVLRTDPSELPNACGSGTGAYLMHALCRQRGVSTLWDLGLVAVTAVVATIAAAALYRRTPTRRLRAPAGSRPDR